MAKTVQIGKAVLEVSLGKSLYSYSDYKKYLQDRIHSEPNGGHGFRRKMADAIGCQLSYISLVLNGDRDLSVEQAEALSRFLGMNSDEREFFIWLLQFQRAGSPGAREFFSALLNKKARPISSVPSEGRKRSDAQ